jgi:hypothetical protein
VAARKHGFSRRAQLHKVSLGAYKVIGFVVGNLFTDLYQHQMLFGDDWG